MGSSSKSQQWAAVGVLMLGFALLVYMIVVEDEPGAVPLAMIIGGAVWLWRTRSKGAE